MGKAGRPPSVERHPKSAAILQAVLTPGANMAQIQRDFGISRKALDTFKAKHITPAMQEAVDIVAELQVETPIAARDVMSKLALLVDRGYRMLEAADAWLEDPNAPGRYDLSPRDHEVEVVWERQVDGPRGRTLTVRKREKVSDILRRCAEKSGTAPTLDEVVVVETKMADPRKLLLEAVATLKPVVELIGKATGQIKPDPAAQVNVLVASPEWIAARARIVTALAAFPEARRAVLEAIGGE